MPLSTDSKVLSSFSHKYLALLYPPSQPSQTTDYTWYPNLALSPSILLFPYPAKYCPLITAQQEAAPHSSLRRLWFYPKCLVRMISDGIVFHSKPRLLNARRLWILVLIGGWNPLAARTYDIRATPRQRIPLLPEAGRSLLDSPGPKYHWSSSCATYSQLRIGILSNTSATVTTVTYRYFFFCFVVCYAHRRN